MFYKSIGSEHGEIVLNVNHFWDETSNKEMGLYKSKLFQSTCHIYYNSNT